MATFGLIEYADASPEVRAVYDDIMATRKTDWINNFWKALAHDPALLKRTWEDIKQLMAPGALDAVTKEMHLRRRQRHQRLSVLHRLAHRLGTQEGHDRCDVPRNDVGGWHGQRQQSARERISDRDR